MFESLIPETGNPLNPVATAELTPQDPNFVADNRVSQPSAYQSPTAGTELLPTPASIGIIDTGFNHWTSADRPDLTIGSDWVDGDRDPFVLQDTLTHGGHDRPHHRQHRQPVDRSWRRSCRRKLDRLLSRIYQPSASQRTKRDRQPQL
uniref:Uncharacterized protein n=1 Tax=Desertifilum tharense IPPAS B-1220 TaxID=1781255 RepID=A0ACD5GWP0_9CYAN